ncbi:hypothetical protein HU200_042774 [Digitaria exilis]|uniref:RIN4 pathogenic type III effector avirulence factor Avr cleavage site domain-containing protein n=1 Tax=Digitaria exilis TaxID=1010633 RepID=A0A835BAP4_9POAL|nr:hypothetical protein HU200_042774 [Digitaria exilis]
MHGRTCVQNRPTVPKFGTWDSDSAGYTVYFEKVRENKGATAPPLHRPFNPNDPDEGPMMTVPPPSSSSSRPATSGGHHEPQQRRPTGPHGQGQGHHRRAGSSSAAAAEQSKFAPPPQFQPRSSPQPAAQHYGDDHHHHRTGGHHQHQSTAAHGGSGGHRALQQRQHHHHAAPAARARSASPQSNTSNGRQRPTTVPKFGVWDEQTAASAAQGFTVQFENVKRHREVAWTAVPAVPRAPSPPEDAAARRTHHHQKTPFLSKMFGCFLPPTTAKD